MLDSIYQKTISGLNSNKIITKILARMSFQIIKKLASIHDPLINYPITSHQINQQLREIELSLTETN
jgi:hypothetical protein